jgi:hypothetical protein
MTDKSSLEAEQARAQRIDLPIYDTQSQSAVSAYLTELEAEKVRQKLDRPPRRRTSF